MTTTATRFRYVFPCGMSRAGTTLLTTILDAHPDVSMGYELLPVGLESIGDAIDRLDRARRAGGETTEACAAWLADQGHAPLAGFVERCALALVEPAELGEILEPFRGVDPDRLDSVEMRARLSMAVVEAKRRREGTARCGFKINAPSVEAFHRVYPDGAFIYIVRDPRDVVASHVAARFDRTTEHICRAWLQYADRFLAFRAEHGDRALIVRYEDLVRRPDAALREILAIADLPDDGSVRRFHRSKASVHTAGHRNAEGLRRDFYTTSVDRWTTELAPEQVAAVVGACRRLMPTFDYPTGA